MELLGNEGSLVMDGGQGTGASLTRLPYSVLTSQVGLDSSRRMIEFPQ